MCRFKLKPHCSVYGNSVSVRSVDPGFGFLSCLCIHIPSFTGLADAGDHDAKFNL